MNDDTGRTVDLMGRIASHSLSATRGLQIQKFGGTARDITWLSRTNCVTKMCTEELSLELWERHSEAALKPVNMEVKPEVVKNINKMKHEVLVASKMRCRSEEKEACRVGQCVDRAEDINGIVTPPYQNVFDRYSIAVASLSIRSTEVLASSDVMKKGQNALLFNPCQCPTTDTDTVDRGCVGEELRNAEGGCLTTNNVRHSSQTCADTFFGKEVGFVEEEQVHGATNGSLALVEKESI
ncbi:hypothetical protein BLNAU_10191 [Blattamonas nauphoetae]|uniref:Uncharacterized protein n=1 Tax=Blattamonas nauphoetae TaxID=2049346 RepID=A0ABQ9XTQ5_9EUKA|nr:hypothetical protein BLNAU_10191 [Blattamonas nauphoetae]